jgi:hypothetical protein
VIVLIAIAVSLSLGTPSPSSSSHTTFSSTNTISGTISGTISSNTPSISTSNSITSTPSTGSGSLNFIAISGGMGLCSHNCNYPSPYLSGTVIVNSTVPLRALQLFINGTSEGTSNYSSSLSIFTFGYKANPTNQSMPIVSGKTYLIVLVAKFQDNSSSVASVIVTAS